GAGRDQRAYEVVLGAVVDVREIAQELQLAVRARVVVAAGRRTEVVVLAVVAGTRAVRLRFARALAAARGRRGGTLAAVARILVAVLESAVARVDQARAGPAVARAVRDLAGRVAVAAITTGPNRSARTGGALFVAVVAAGDDAASSRAVAGTIGRHALVVA